jgi:ubiquinone/menaquinone biosynthesis C-methylase UbiE
MPPAEQVDAVRGRFDLRAARVWPKMATLRAMAESPDIGKLVTKALTRAGLTDGNASIDAIERELFDALRGVDVTRGRWEHVFDMTGTECPVAVEATALGTDIIKWTVSLSNPWLRGTTSVHVYCPANPTHMSDDDDIASACSAGYDLWSATYESMDNPLVALSAAVMDTRRDWMAGADVLELGCGTGRNARTCLAAGARSYLGADASVGMIEEARRRVADPRASFVVADVREGPAAADLGSRTFDLVLVCLVLEHFPRVEGILATAAAVLTRGGRAWLHELHPALHDKGIRAHFRHGDGEVKLPSFRHDAAELTAALEGAGLHPFLCAEHTPSAAALARSRKLARYLGQPMLLELAATR